jgi:hypothetical protein
VGQFGTLLRLDFQLIATEFLALSRKFFTLLFTPTLGQSVGQFGTILLLDFQLIAMAFSGLSRKFFTLLFTPTLGQLGGTVWDNAIA